MATQKIVIINSKLKINANILNFRNAAGCNAVSHCIQTTWETQTYPEDNDDICTICKNMVKEARDTLTSNVTLVSVFINFFSF